MLELARSGVRVQELANKYFVDKQTIYHHLDKAGIITKSPKYSRKTIARRFVRFQGNYTVFGREKINMGMTYREYRDQEQLRLNQELVKRFFTPKLQEKPNIITPMKEYPCIENQLDLTFGDKTIRLWIDEDEVKEDYANIGIYRNISDHLETKPTNRELVKLIKKDIPRLNAIQVVSSITKNLSQGPMVYFVDF